MKKNPKQKKVLTAKQKQRRRITGYVILGIVLVLLIALAIYIYPIFKISTNLFPTVTMAPLRSAAPDEAVVPDLFPSGNADRLLPEGKLNVLLIGVDQEDKTYSEDYHSDTMIVLALDFDAGTADMISLRRDTFAHIPGVRGIYKLNGSINTGGGLYAENDAGFMKVCEAAEWMLGGLPVDYFVAIQLPALIEVVDILGGVDYNVDVDYAGLVPGYQHLNGEQVMWYVRARKEMTVGATGDVARVARQKNMLLTILKKLQNEGKITQLPQLLGVVQKGLFTNLNTQQILALLNFARGLDADAMGTYSFDGPMHMAASWAFCFPDQEARIALIEQIYGVTVEAQEYVSYEHAKWYNSSGFSAVKRMAVAGRIIAYAETCGWLDGDPDRTAQLQSAKDKAVEAQALFDVALASLGKSDTSAMTKASRDLQTLAEALSKACAYPEKENWYVLPDWTADSDINEIYVDFR